MHHVQLTLTYNRFTLTQRALYYFLNQKTQHKTTLLLFNTGAPFELGHFDIPENKHILLINDQKTEYKTVGEKYTEALKYLPADAQVVNILDSDDGALDHHIEQGVNGLLESKVTAWKPAKSYFHSNNNLTLESNVFEGSIFIKADHLREQGFYSDYTVKYHDKWLHTATVCVDHHAKPSFLYDWSNPTHLNTYKMSGRLESDLNNFEDSQRKSNDFGTGILTPSSEYLIKI